MASLPRSVSISIFAFDAKSVFASSVFEGAPHSLLTTTVEALLQHLTAAFPDFVGEVLTLAAVLRRPSWPKAWVGCGWLGAESAPEQWIHCSPS